MRLWWALLAAQAAAVDWRVEDIPEDTARVQWSGEELMALTRGDEIAVFQHTEADQWPAMRTFSMDWLAALDFPMEGVHVGGPVYTYWLPVADQDQDPRWALNAAPQEPFRPSYRDERMGSTEFVRRLKIANDVYAAPVMPPELERSVSHPHRGLWGLGDPEGVAVNLWLAGRGTTITPHWDMGGTLNTQLRGDKEWLFWPASEAAHLHMNPYSRYEYRQAAFDPVLEPEPDPRRFPLAARLAAPRRVVMRPGDTLVMPAFTIHRVRCLSAECVSVTHRTKQAQFYLARFHRIPLIERGAWTTRAEREWGLRRVALMVAPYFGGLAAVRDAWASQYAPTFAPQRSRHFCLGADASEPEYLERERAALQPIMEGVARPAAAHRAAQIGLAAWLEQVAYVAGGQRREVVPALLYDCLLR